MTIKTFADLFAGIGGFHLAASQCGLRCAFASETDDHAREQYEASFGIVPDGDIHEVATAPAHDLLLAGFPCQPFSVAGDRKGVQDVRGTLFGEIVRVLEAAKPSAFVLENVDGLTGMPDFQIILAALEKAGYEVRWRVFNALDFGLCQHRKRVWIVGRRDGKGFRWPTPPKSPRPLAEVLEPSEAVPDALWLKTVPKNFRAPTKRQSVLSRPIRGFKYDQLDHAPTLRCHTGGDIYFAAVEPYIVHTSFDYHRQRANDHACALRSNPSPNYQLVNGVRRFTPREMLRFQGFPESYRFVSPRYPVVRRLIGNSLPVPVAKAVIQAVLEGAETMPATQADLLATTA